MRKLSYKKLAMVLGLIGSENITSIDNCITRFRNTITYMSKL